MATFPSVKTQSQLDVLSSDYFTGVGLYQIIRIHDQ